MEEEGYTEILIFLGKYKEVFHRSILCAGVPELEIEEKDGGTLLRVKGNDPYKLLKNTHSLVSSCIFMIKSLKEIETLN